MKFTPKLIGVIAVAVFLLLSMSLFTVHETEKAMRFQLGRIVQDDYAPGLHFQIPFVNNVKKFDARVQTLDSDPGRFLTAEKKNVMVDAFVKWRIGSVSTFFTNAKGDFDFANQRLDQIIKDSLRSEFSKRTVKDVVSGDRRQIMENLSAIAKAQGASLGLDVVDVRIKRIDLPAEVSGSVFDRMAAERERVARDFRSRGAEAAERIRADADRQSTVILAEAYRDAEVVRGNGDATAADIYATAFGADAEFYSFHRSLSGYRNTFNSKNDVILLKPDSEFFKYFNQADLVPKTE